MPVCDLCQCDCESYIHSSVVAYSEMKTDIGSENTDWTGNTKKVTSLVIKSNFTPLDGIVCYKCFKKDIYKKRRSLFLRKIIKTLSICIPIMAGLLILTPKINNFSNKNDNTIGLVAILLVLLGIIIYNIYRYNKGKDIINHMEWKITTSKVWEIERNLNDFAYVSLFTPIIDRKIQMLNNQHHNNLTHYMTCKEFEEFKKQHPHTKEELISDYWRERFKK